MGIGGSIGQGEKFSASPDKWLLGRDPERSWPHLHASTELFILLQRMDPWTLAAA
jgi:hypothetical protein